MILKIHIDEDAYSLIVNKEELNFLFNAFINIDCEDCEEFSSWLGTCRGNREKCKEIRKFIKNFKEKVKGEEK